MKNQEFYQRLLKNHSIKDLKMNKSNFKYIKNSYNKSLKRIKSTIKFKDRYTKVLMAFNLKTLIFLLNYNKILENIE